MAKKEHLKDINWSSRKERRENHIEDFKNWYRVLSNQPYSERINGQLTILSVVLWYLTEDDKYKAVPDKASQLLDEKYIEQLREEGLL